jgi:hypothetical protein
MRTGWKLLGGTTAAGMLAATLIIGNSRVVEGMRAASDETAMMDPSDSVVAVSSAVSQAAEHVERARDAVRALNAIVSRS